MTAGPGLVDGIGVLAKAGTAGPLSWIKAGKRARYEAHNRAAGRDG